MRRLWKNNDQADLLDCGGRACRFLTDGWAIGLPRGPAWRNFDADLSPLTILGGCRRCFHTYIGRAWLEERLWGVSPPGDVSTKGASRVRSSKSPLYCR
jgi:hypothetical protein